MTLLISASPYYFGPVVLVTYGILSGVLDSVVPAGVQELKDLQKDPPTSCSAGAPQTFLVNFIALLFLPYEAHRLLHHVRLQVMFCDQSPCLSKDCARITS